MTEQEWSECTDLQNMLIFLVGKGSDRKFRLFACQCVRDGVFVPEDVRVSRAIGVAELMAESVATETDIQEAKAAIQMASMEATNAWCYLTAAAADILITSAIDGASSTLENMRIFDLELTSAFDQARYAMFLRCIFGNPFFPIAVNPAWLAWNDGTVRKIAQSIYVERAFDRMPILADALMDAGCDNADLLNHCRSEGPHVKGCWVVDLLLGKE